MSVPVFRFAPSPNGRLHLGHAYSALFTFHAATSCGGRFLLRIEDIDTTRCKPEFTAAIFADLQWLGLTWPEPVLVQSERLPLYAEVAGRLHDLDLLYPCFCSRSEIAAAARDLDPDGAPLYPGTCRTLSPGVAERRLAAGAEVQWRLHGERAMSRAGPLSFRLAQPTPGATTRWQLANPEPWGDVVIQRKRSTTSYHLSVVVDDDAQGITNVTRGRDMQASTDIHVLLQHLLEVATPIYTFHDLITDGAGRKLAKSRGSTALADLRESGWTAEAIRARLGFS